MKRIILAVFLSVPAKLLAQPYEPKEVAGWTIAPLQDNDGSCFMTMSYKGEGSTQLFLTINYTGKPYLMIRNDNWSIEEGSFYDLDYILSAGSYKNHRSVGTSNRGFITVFESKFTLYFAKSGFLHIERQGVLVDRLSLRGSGAAIAELNRCAAQIKREVDTLARERRKLQDIPVDPFSAAHD